MDDSVRWIVSLDQSKWCLHSTMEDSHGGGFIDALITIWMIWVCGISQTPLYITLIGASIIFPFFSA